MVLPLGYPSSTAQVWSSPMQPHAPSFQVTWIYLHHFTTTHEIKVCLCAAPDVVRYVIQIFKCSERIFSERILRQRWERWLCHRSSPCLRHPLQESCGHSPQVLTSPAVLVKTVILKSHLGSAFNRKALFTYISIHSQFGMMCTPCGWTGITALPLWGVHRSATATKVMVS